MTSKRDLQYQSLDDSRSNVPKFIFQNGRAILNPEYKSKTGSAAPSAPPRYEDVAAQPLTAVTTLQDQVDITEVTKLDAPQNFQETLKVMQSPAYIKQFAVDDIDSGELIDGLTSVFGRYEIPIGLMSKLTVLQGARLHFKIDDSGSMNDPSNLLLSDVSVHMQEIVGNQSRKFVTRWEEAQDRLHILIDLLAYVPTGPIVLSFFDRPSIPGKKIVLDRSGKTPDAFLTEAHNAIYQLFTKKPSGGTPILTNMKSMMAEADEYRRSSKNSDCRTMHYLLSDGEPDGQAMEIGQIKNFLKSPNRNARLNPFTFLGCSNQRRDYAWMHEMEEIADCVAALPDFKDELQEVLRDQGSTFPYSRGMWLLCNVAAAINPDDLDALDQHAPLTKATLEDLMGRGIMDSEYLQYFNSHPNARRIFGPDYQLFMTYQFARDIPSVRLFQDTLKNCLSRDMDNGEDDSEDRDELIAEQAVIYSRQPRYSGTMFGRSNSREPLLSSQESADQQSFESNCCCVIL